MANVNIEGTNLLGDSFKDYVNDQINTRQEILGKTNKSTENITWENAKSAYIALASSVNLSSLYDYDDDSNLIREITSKGEKRAKDLNLPGDPNQYVDDTLARNVVLYGGTAYFDASTEKGKNIFKNYNAQTNETPMTPSYRYGVSNTTSPLNKAAYGFGGTEMGQAAMPGITSFNIKSRNMGSLREATVTIRANSKEQFGYIDTLYNRIGYTMFLEWGNSIYYNNKEKYISDPNSEGVYSLLDTFLSGKGNYITDYELDRLDKTPLEGNYLRKDIKENPSLFLQLIERNRQLSNGNYDAFFGKVKNFKWNFNKNGYYEITLSLISQGDIIESLQIDNLTNIPEGNYSSYTIDNLENPQDHSTALASFISIVSTPNTLRQEVIRKEEGLISLLYVSSSENMLTYDRTHLIPKYKIKIKGGTFVDADGNTFNIPSSSSLVSSPETPDGISDLNYIRPAHSIGTSEVYSGQNKIPSTFALFYKDFYYYIRFGDLLDFIKDRLLLYSSRGDNEPILDIDTDPDRNIMYDPGLNMSADPSKLIISRGEIPYYYSGSNGDTIMSLYNETHEYLPNSDDEDLAYMFPVSSSSGAIHSQFFENSEYWRSRTQFLPNIEPFSSTKDPNDPNNTDFIRHGKIMNIYFESSFVLGLINELRDYKTSSFSLFEFVKTLLNEANSVLGGVNRLTVRLDDDRVMRIYDQTSLYGVITKKDKQDAIINLYGITPDKQGSFVTDFNIKTELTNDLATIVSIGASSQGINTQGDATGLSAWNEGLIDRFYPNKIDSLGKYDNVKVLTTEELLHRTKQEMSSLWLGYSGMTISYIEVRNEEIDNTSFFFWGYYEKYKREISKFAAFPYFPDRSNYGRYVNMQKRFLSLLTQYTNEEYIKYLRKNQISKDSIEYSTATNQQGMIPLNIQVTIEGLSGIRIYDKLNIDTRFLPNYYPQSLYWVIKGVSHEIKNNKWYTKLDTLAYPILPNKEYLIEVAKGDFTSNSTPPPSPKQPSNLRNNITGNTRWADLLRTSLSDANQIRGGGWPNEEVDSTGGGVLTSSGNDITFEMYNLAEAVFDTIFDKVPERYDPLQRDHLKSIRYTITAGNDIYHSGLGGNRHKTGNAIRFIVGEPTDTSIETKRLREKIDRILLGITLGTANMGYINEYRNVELNGVTSEGLPNGNFYISYGTKSGLELSEYKRASDRWNDASIPKEEYDPVLNITPQLKFNITL